MKTTKEQKTKLDDWFSDHVEIIGASKEVKKAVEKKIKDGLMKNYTQLKNKYEGQ